jgi:hypothetical protein
LHLQFSKSNALQSALIYSAGDTIASLMLHSFSYQRMLGVAIIGGTLYSLEIPNYFNWINVHTHLLEGLKASVRRTILALLYFNPLWIARHLLLVQIVSGNYDAISWNLLLIGYRSFINNILYTIPINFLIQNKISLHRRFLVSSMFSAVMAIYYALSQVWFK